MVHPALFRAEVRFCGNFGGNAVIRYPQRDCVDTWEKPPPGKGGGQTLRNEMSRIRTLERAPVVPEVPTVAEAGYRSLNHDDLVGLFSTSGMSMEMRERIASDVRAILADPAVATRVAATGQIVSPGTPAESRPR
jgi:hypothetical protein